jgi:large subunit ribosomal protein L35
MPKMKSHRGAAKRLKRTGSGKISRHKAFNRHILTSKGPKRKRALGRTVIVTGKMARSLNIMLPR